MSFNVNNNNNNQQAQYKTIKLKGKNNPSLNLNKLEGLRLTERHEGLKKFDENKDGILQKNEVENLAKTLEDVASNSKLSKREIKKAFGDKSVFESIKSLAEQQNTLEQTGSYTETNGNTSTHVFKDHLGTYSYTKTTAEDGSITTISDDGTKQISHKDGSKEITDPNGKTIKYDKNGKKVSVTENGNTTTFPDDNTSVTKNSDGKIIQTITEKDGKIINTKFEYQDGKTIEREYSDLGNDAPLTSITVKEQKDGHKIDTKYNSEDDMKNNRPSEKITDAHNPAQKSVTKYTYDDNGNVKAETTDSAGNKTIKNFNTKGEEISDPNPQKTHTVVKGESITQIVKNALAEQGIENPTKEELNAAKKEFLELNKDIVKTYNGVKQEWKGNKFFYPDDVVKIPDFGKSEKTEEVTLEEPVKAPETSQTEEPTTQETSPDLAARKKEVEERLGDGYQVNITSEGTLEVRDTNGNLLPEVTKIANGATSHDAEVNLMMAHDENKNQALDADEYKNFMTTFISEAGIEINDSNRAKIEALITESFNSMDNIEQNGSLSKEELKKNAEEIINKLADDINAALDNSTEDIETQTALENQSVTLNIEGVDYEAQIITLENGQKAYEIDGGYYTINDDGTPGALISE